MTFFPKLFAAGRSNSNPYYTSTHVSTTRALREGNVVKAVQAATSKVSRDAILLTSSTRLTEKQKAKLESKLMVRTELILQNMQTRSTRLTCRFEQTAHNKLVPKSPVSVEALKALVTDFLELETVLLQLRDKIGAVGNESLTKALEKFLTSDEYSMAKRCVEAEKSLTDAKGATPEVPAQHGAQRPPSPVTPAPALPQDDSPPPQRIRPRPVQAPFYHSPSAILANAAQVRANAQTPLQQAAANAYHAVCQMELNVLEQLTDLSDFIDSGFTAGTSANRHLRMAQSHSEKAKQTSQAVQVFEMDFSGQRLDRNQAAMQRNLTALRERANRVRDSFNAHPDSGQQEVQFVLDCLALIERALNRAIRHASEAPIRPAPQRQIDLSAKPVANLTRSEASRELLRIRAQIRRGTANLEERNRRVLILNRFPDLD